jgi:hypothetical protein
MPTTASTQAAITSLEAYQLSGQFHGLVVCKIEGLDGEPVTKLARLLNEHLLRQRTGKLTARPGRFWVGTTVPSLQIDWHMVEVTLLECVPTRLRFAPDPRYQAFRLGGIFNDQSRTRGAQHPVLFRGGFMIIHNSDGSNVESQVGYIKCSLAG